jgi:TRAP-type uncharacterized transport system substrate-binding protein
MPLLAAVLIAGCSRGPTELIFVDPISPIDKDIITDLTELLHEESSFSLSLTEARLSGEEAMDAVLTGDADLALISNAHPFRNGIATVIPLYPTILHIGYFGDREINDRGDLLRGATVYAGPEGSASRMIFNRTAERLDLSDDDYRFVERGEQPDVFVVFAPIATDRIRQLPDVRLFSMGAPDSVGTGSSVDAATLLYPFLRPFIIPVGTYGDATPQAVLTTAVDKMIVARRDIDTSVIYSFISELLRLRPALAARRPGLFRDLTGDFDASSSTFVLHSGAQAYLERSEPSVYERYSGIAEVGVTVLIALISAILGGMRLFRMRRKNRIDAYYSEVIGIRNHAEQSGDTGDNQELIDKLKALQNKAFAELVDEKLAANESFRIFITLSNDVLRQLGAGSGPLPHSDE